MRYCKTRLTTPASAVTKHRWTLFEEVKAKNGRWWQCRVDFVTQKSLVRNVRPKRVLPTLIFSRCCTFVSCGNCANIRPIVHTKAIKTTKKVCLFIETWTLYAISVFWDTIKSKQNVQIVSFSCSYRSSDSVTRASCISVKLWYGRRFFFSKVCSLRRVGLSNSLNSVSQVMFWAFEMMRGPTKRLSILWFQ